MRFAATLAVVLTWPLLTAGSCATTREPIVRVERVEVPVVKPCVPSDTPPAPVYLDGKEALVSLGKGAADQRYHLVAGEWFRKEDRLSLLEKIVALCR